MEAHVFDIISEHVHLHLKPLQLLDHGDSSPSFMWSGAVCFTSFFKIHIFFNVVEFLFQPDERNESGGGKAPSQISSLCICGVADTPAERRLVLKKPRRAPRGSSCFHCIHTVPNNTTLQVNSTDRDRASPANSLKP